MERLTSVSDSLVERYRQLSRTTKLILLAWVCVQLCLTAIVWYLGPSNIFASIAHWANGLRESKAGWIWLALVIAIASFPPVLGYTTACTVCGFAFGLRDGFFIALLGAMSGGVGSFLLARLVLLPYAKRMLEGQRTLTLLGSALQSKGTVLIALMRLCPFPWSYSNFFFATIKEVSFMQFFVGTLIGLPFKLFLHVYIGTRLFLFSDPDQLHHMDPTTKVLNAASIVVSVLIGAGVGWYVYRLTMAYAVEGRVSLDEDDLERFLEEEDELEREEESATRPSAGYTLDEEGADSDGEVDRNRSTSRA